MRRSYSTGDEIKLELGQMKFDFTGQRQYIALPKGEYFLQCWGAQGGIDETEQNTASELQKGCGGYSSGIIKLTALTDVYIYVGGSGNKLYSDVENSSQSTDGGAFIDGGFNGGGGIYEICRLTYSKGPRLYNNLVGGAGGGGTDIRINDDSLFARVIVAGGGGGSETGTCGGFGGGFSGSCGNDSGSDNGGLPGYINRSGGNTAWEYDYCGSFGQGHDAVYEDYLLTMFPGGGGWFGGGAGAKNTSYSYYAGGGGSGYIYNSDTSSYYPEGCLLTQSYYLRNGITITASKGQNVFPSPYGSSESGHSGHGYCIISGYASYEVNKVDEIIIPYVNSGTYIIPSGMAYADIFLVNGGNAGSASTSSSYEGFGGQGGNYYSATNISLGSVTSATITIGAGGVPSTNTGKGGTTQLQFGSNTYKPTDQSTAATYATTGTTAKNGVVNPLNSNDVNFYGASGGKGRICSSYPSQSNHEGYSGGLNGGGKGGFCSYYGRNEYGRYIRARSGSLFGAGGGGGARYYSDAMEPGNGYQGICIIKYKKHT